jgi:bud site selection protein 20
VLTLYYRVKALSVEAYSQKEAEAARGIGSVDTPASQQTVKEVEMS